MDGAGSGAEVVWAVILGTGAGSGIVVHRDVLEGELSHYPHWVRSVAAEPQERYANRPWLLWQYTAAGRVPGIPTEVDLNAFYGGRAEWAKFVASSCDPRFAALETGPVCLLRASGRH